MGSAPEGVRRRVNAIKSIRGDYSRQNHRGGDRKLERGCKPLPRGGA
jgi:hypothetical protein